MNKPLYETSHQMGAHSPLTILLVLGFFPLLGIGLLTLGIYTTYVSIVHDGYPILMIFLFLLLVVIIAFFFILYGWATISRGLARYRFETNGLLVKYPLRPWCLIPWDKFQQVCIIYAAYTTRGERRANTAICCVKNGEKKAGNGRWKADNPFRFSSVISIAYTPELHEGIKDKCPYEVCDLRETQAYKLK